MPKSDMMKSGAFDMARYMALLFVGSFALLLASCNLNTNTTDRQSGPSGRSAPVFSPLNYSGSGDRVLGPIELPTGTYILAYSYRATHDTNLMIFHFENVSNPSELLHRHPIPRNPAGSYDGSIIERMQGGTYYLEIYDTASIANWAVTIRRAN